MLNRGFDADGEPFEIRLVKNAMFRETNIFYSLVNN